MFKEGDKVRFVSYDSKFYRNSKEYTKRDKLIIGNEYIIDEIINNGMDGVLFLKIKDTPGYWSHAYDCFEFSEKTEPIYEIY